ncbi:MAG: hypothetical protein JW748_07720 [Anaerolineales bacterium]|nr:hypothetical protein [Anaerolineales bacterium]
MLSDDYIIRMVRQGSIVLSRILGLKKAGDYPGARQEINLAMEQVLGVNMEFINIMDDESIVNILTKDEQIDLVRLGMIAELFKEEGDIFTKQNRDPESRNSYRRSLNFYLAKIAEEDPSQQAESSARIDEIISHIAINELPTAALLNLFCYYENRGKYANADTILGELAARPEATSDAKKERISFYRRLLEMNPEETAAGGLNSEEIKGALNDM